MVDFSLQQLLLRFAGLLFVVGIHGWVVAVSAQAFRDPGPKYDGRRTPSPLPHLDPLGTLGMLFFSLGWIRPLAVDPTQLSHPRRDPILIVLVSSAATLAVALLLHLVRPLLFTVLPGAAGVTALSLINTTVGLSLWFTLLNLLPIPPLTGSFFLMALAPSHWQTVMRFRKYSAVALAALIYVGLAKDMLAPVYRALVKLL